MWQGRINAPKGWTATLEGNELAVKSPAEASMEKTERIDIVITSSKQYQRTVTLEAKLINTTFDAAYCNAWKEFASGTEENVLPDFSYAGYMHGEVAPPDVETSGYQLINVCDFGAVPNDGQSDRQAFIDAIASIKGVQKTVGNVKPGTNGGAASQTIRLLNNKPSNAIIYFPEGEFILQDESEVNQTIDITMSNLVIKGAGREQTIIRMDSKNKLTNGRDMWTSPCMIQLKHYSGPSDLCDVTGNADKGSHEVAVSSTTGIRAGDWVCLSLLNNNPDLVAEEVAPHPASDLNTAIVSIAQEGVEVIDYHQVAAVGNNKLTFAEPIMRKVEAKYGWKIKKYPHYENIGVEDLTFQGKAEEKFQHHEPSTGAGTSFDGDYKLIDFTRLTNSWMRRVNFVSVSEALSITSSANVSAYDIKISGNRGHSAVRSASSSRVFIGKVTDQSDGYRIPKAGQLAEFMKGAGQYHGCGVSKPSMGVVIWNVRWGEDGCYEAHASQPRATLIDRCTGAFIPSRQGGSEYEVPNHLGDLIIWNMNATRAGYESEWGNRFVFWDKNSKWCKAVYPLSSASTALPSTLRRPTSAT